jgi:aspartyl-tRNA(Asn)/glutamyl-tRNA(Gln) amidotransferase subunit B
MNLESVIGLEIHVQLKTASKMFCSCSNRGEFEAPNITVCEICLGHPGTLPVVNAKAVRFGVLAGLALGGKIAGHSKFDRKNYFYPDLPKGYQISQFDLPIVSGGVLQFTVKSEDGAEIVRECRITRLHLEEDAAKLSHAPDGGSSLVDYNRAGTPLAEIVTEPDMRSPAEAKAFLQELRLMMRYLGVSDADMEKGHLRCDANISLREAGTERLFPKTEVKNINSFRSVERALDYEIKRQTKLWLDDMPPMVLTTRGWDDAKGITVEHRTKEGASDYRYFPEPDLPPLHLTELGEEMRGLVPELPAARRQRFVEEYGFSKDDAATICDDIALADYAEEVFSELQEWASSAAKAGGKPFDWALERPQYSRLVSGWLLTKLRGVMTEHKIDIRILKILPAQFAELIVMVAQKKVTGANGLVILTEMALSGVHPATILRDKNLGLIEDTGELEMAVKNVIAANEKSVADYRGGKEAAIMFLVGQVMRLTKGKADPETAKAVLRKELGG